ncbi:MAG: sugar transferase [Phycisphaerae bacterium]|nr:sugar transferase [Phycisphaerae bacterium]
MQITIIHSENDRSANECGFLRFAISNRNTASVVLKGISDAAAITKGASFIAMPAKWQVKDIAGQREIVFYDNNTIYIPPDGHNAKWTVIANARYAASIDYQKLRDIADSHNTDILAVNVDPNLSAYREKVRLTPSSHVVGFSRWYSDSIIPASIPKKWPHYLFVRSNVLTDLLSENHLPLSFETLILRAKRNGMEISSLSVGGTFLDLNTPDGLLKYTAATLDKMNSNTGISDKGPKLYGKILTGKNVTFGKNVKIIGPTVIEDNVSVPDDAIINNSIIASGQAMQPGQIVNNTIYFGNSCRKMQSKAYSMAAWNSPEFIFPDDLDQSKKYNVFRTWPLFSYPRIGKRFIDLTGSIFILTLLAPVLLILAIMIKLTSRGPVFYKAVRQGRYGRQIKCLKFRTMIAGAEKMQEKLRIVNEVDGPQFKIVHDPRISAIGRFLRDTCLDETPQFFNVLLGQMSIVGPRPSPENENSQCPSWRDARLSVRPGITGLWQISRTRRPSRDFQEWVHYDTEYIRRLSLKTDLQICCKTAMKLINDFIDQF